MQPRTVSELFPSKWLKAEDLGSGKIVTISSQRIELMKPFAGDVKEPKLILSFERATKELICTKSQARALADISGTEEFSKWVGLRVRLSPQRLATGKMTIAITSAPAPAAPPAEITPVELYAPAEETTPEADPEPTFDF